MINPWQPGQSLLLVQVRLPSPSAQAHWKKVKPATRDFTGKATARGRFVPQHYGHESCAHLVYTARAALSWAHQKLLGSASGSQ